MKKGYLVALGGVLIFPASIILARLLNIQGDATGPYAAGSFGLMVLAFWVGTAWACVEKGYHLVIGVLLGLFAPLSLLIVTFLPERPRQ